METSMTVGKMFPGILASVLLGEILTFFCCGLEYRKTQRLQFEDDDYYYYVKAVPKVDGEYFLSDEQPEDIKEEDTVLPEKTSAREYRRQTAGEDVQIQDLESKLEKAMQQIQE